MRLYYAPLILLAFSTLAAPSARAEYRVFQLAITDTQTGLSRTVISTLDDIQYPGYYHVKKSERIDIQETWMCWGRQGDFKKPCPAPSARSNASVPPR